MSAVLMCDSCTELFSVNEEGWRELQERISASQGNAFNNGMRSLHTCAKCAGGNRAKRPTVGGVLELESAAVVETDVEYDDIAHEIEVEEEKNRRLRRENPPREKETVRQYETRIRGLMKA